MHLIPVDSVKAYCERAKRWGWWVLWLTCLRLMLHYCAGYQWSVVFLDRGAGLACNRISRSSSVVAVIGVEIGT